MSCRAALIPQQAQGRIWQRGASPEGMSRDGRRLTRRLQVHPWPCCESRTVPCSLLVCRGDGEAEGCPHSPSQRGGCFPCRHLCVPLDARALQTPNAEKCLTEQHTYSKHCLIHVLKSHLQAYFPSSDINHCKYVLINKATQTDCLFHPYHRQVTGQHPGERSFPAHPSPPWRTPAQGVEEKQWETC